MSIHFKFKSAKEFDTVTFPGTVIRVLDLKKAIIEKKKLNKGLDFDLVITDAQNGKVYDDENMQLPRNTSVTVKRIPSHQPGSGLLARMKAEAAAAAAAAAAPVMVPSPVISMGVPMPVPPMPLNAAPASSETATSDDMVGAQTMEDELAALQSIHEQAEDMRGARLGNKTWTAQGGSNADKVMNYYSGGRGGGPGGGGRGFMGVGRGPMGGRGEFGGPMGGRGRGGAMGGPPGMHNNPNQAMGNPPPNYVCYRCGTPGHYIQNCPTNGDPEYDQHRVKKKTGIPKSFMKAVNDPSEIPVGAGKTVVNAPWGGLAVIEPQNKNFSKLMAKSGGSATLDQFIANPPDHLACPLCKRLMNDAVLIPCCQESACDECLRSALIEKKLTCPLCNTTNMSPEKLLPNKVLRTSVDEFLRRARTEQQEREQLVKEAEEKALAKQKAEMAVSTAGRRSGESADATLEIKKGKKDEEEEEDEFGGDIFGSGDENDDSQHHSSVVAQASPPLAPVGSPAGENPTPPLPKEEATAADEQAPSRKSSDVSMGTSVGEGQAADAPDAARKGNGADQQQLGPHGQQQHPPPHLQGPPGHQMPWPMGPPRGPGMGFPPPEPWFDGPPRAPGPWFDGPPPPWFDGPFPGPGGPRGIKGGRGGRGMPPPGYFGGPPPDYFGPPPGHPDYFGPPMHWFDGPAPPFNGGGRGNGMWFEGDRGFPPRGRDEDPRRHQSDSRDLGKDGGRDASEAGKEDHKDEGSSKRAAGERSTSSKDRRDRGRSRSRSRSRSRGGGRGRKSQHGRSRSRSFSRSRKHDRSQGRELSRSRCSRSESRDQRRERKNGSRPSSPRAPYRDGKNAKESIVSKDREVKAEEKATVEDVKVDQVAAPAIDLDFLEGNDEPSESEAEQQSNISPSKPAEDKTETRRDDGDRGSRDTGSASCKRSSSPGRRNRSSERERGSEKRSSGASLSGSGPANRSRSRSASRRRSLNDSSRRKGEPSSSSGNRGTRSGERNSSARDQDRNKGRDRAREKERERGRDRDRPRDRGDRGDRRDRDSKRSRDEDANADGRDKKKRRSFEKDQQRGEKRGEKNTGSGRVVVASTSSKGKGSSSSGGQGGGRGGNSRNNQSEKRRVEFSDDKGADRGKKSGASRKRGDDSRASKSFGENQTKKRSVLDRLGPAL